MSETKKILYYGGSITCGARATDYENSWAKRSFRAISQALYGENVEMINASISGTGSHLGALRLHRDVLPYKPDLVFVEFAVNDKGISAKDPQRVISGMDYIVQALKKSNPDVAIAFVYTTSQGKNAAHVHTLVARHYDIPEIDLQTPVTALVESGRRQWSDLLADTCHPTDEGHALYGQLVAQAVLADPARFRKPVKDAPSISAFPICDPYILSAREAVAMEGFALQPVEDTKLMKHLERLRVTQAAVSDRPGDTITFDFEGGHFAVHHRVGATMGRFSVTVDGKWLADVNCYHKYSSGPVEKGEYLSFLGRASLGRGKHRVVIQVLEKSEMALSPQVIIAGIFVG